MKNRASKVLELALYRLVARSVPQHFGGDPALRSRDSRSQREAGAAVLDLLAEAKVRDESSDVAQRARFGQQDVSRFEVPVDYRRPSKKRSLMFVLTFGCKRVHRGSPTMVAPQMTPWVLPNVGWWSNGSFGEVCPLQVSVGYTCSLLTAVSMNNGFAL